MAKKKGRDEGLDFGKPPPEEQEDFDETVDEETVDEQPPEPVEQQHIQEVVPDDMNRIVEDDEEIRFSGTVRPEDIPRCPCCNAEWGISEGTMAAPGCGCMIHPVCTKCGKCEPHCGGHR
jgi:hypothetical protein